MNSIEKIKEEIIKLLFLVLDDKISAKEAIDKWPKINSQVDKKINIAWHELWHFYSDEDIRKKDKKYAEYQLRKLRKIVNDLSREKRLFSRSKSNK